MINIAIVGTRKAELGTKENDVVGKYEVLSKSKLIERIEELTDEDVGYTILKVGKNES